MASKRFLMVPEDSSAARMPRPGATMAAATLFNSARFIGASFVMVLELILKRDRDFAVSSRDCKGPDHVSLNISTPGSDLPSSHSRKAPPAVDT